MLCPDKLKCPAENCYLVIVTNCTIPIPMECRYANPFKAWCRISSDSFLDWPNLFSLSSTYCRKVHWHKKWWQSTHAWKFEFNIPTKVWACQEFFSYFVSTNHNTELKAYPVGSSVLINPSHLLMPHTHIHTHTHTHYVPPAEWPGRVPKQCSEMMNLAPVQEHNHWKIVINTYTHR